MESGTITTRFSFDEEGIFGFLETNNNRYRDEQAHEKVGTKSGRRMR